MTVYVHFPQVPYVLEIENGSSFELGPKLRKAVREGTVLDLHVPENVTTRLLLNLGQQSSIVISDGDRSDWEPLARLKASRLEDLLT